MVAKKLLADRVLTIGVKPPPYLLASLDALIAFWTVKTVWTPIKIAGYFQHFYTSETLVLDREVIAKNILFKKQNERT